MVIPDGSVKRAVRYDGRDAYYVWFISDEWREKFDLPYVEFTSKDDAISTLLTIADSK